MITHLLTVLYVTAAFADGGFWTPETLPTRPAELERALKATVKVGDCTGIVVSNAGYVVMPIHCVQDCIQNGWDFETHVGHEDVKVEGLYSYQKITTPVPKDFYCPRFRADNYYIWAFHWRLEKILLLGNGKQNHDESRIADLSEEDFAKFKDLNEDVAILKYSVADRGYPSTCVPIAKERSKPGATVWAIGFPTDTKRQILPDSDGRSQYVSYGRVKITIDSDPLLQKFAADLAPEKRALFWQREKAIWEKPSLLISNIDAVSGNSGSSVLNEKGEVEAMVFTVTKSDTKNYNASNTYSFRVEALEALARFHLGDQETDRIFNCSNASTLSLWQP